MAWRWPGEKPLSEPLVVRLPTHYYIVSLGLKESNSQKTPQSTMGHCYDETWQSQWTEPYLFIFIWEFLVGPRCCHSEINFRQIRMFLDQFLSICLIPQLKRCLTGSTRQQKRLRQLIINKTDVGRRQTLGHPSSINPNMINHVPNNHLSFSKSNMLSVHEAIKISYSYHLPCQGSRNCQSQIYVSNHSFVDMVWSPFQYCPSI